MPELKQPTKICSLKNIVRIPVSLTVWFYRRFKREIIGQVIETIFCYFINFYSNQIQIVRASWTVRSHKKIVIENSSIERV